MGEKGEDEAGVKGRRVMALATPPARGGWIDQFCNGERTSTSSNKLARSLDATRRRGRRRCSAIVQVGRPSSTSRAKPASTPKRTCCAGLASRLVPRLLHSLLLLYFFFPCPSFASVSKTMYMILHPLRRLYSCRPQSRDCSTKIKEENVPPERACPANVPTSCALIEPHHQCFLAQTVASSPHLVPFLRR